MNSTYISLDGVIANPQNWPSGRHEDDGRGIQLQGKLLQSSEVLLMGRRTDEGVAPVWSAKSGDPFSDKFNSIEKWVASTTLNGPDWRNTEVLGGDAVEQIRARKQGPGAAADLIFRPASQTIFDLAETTPLASGIVVLTYRK